MRDTKWTDQEIEAFGDKTLEILKKIDEIHGPGPEPSQESLNKIEILIVEEALNMSERQCRLIDQTLKWLEALEKINPTSALILRTIVKVSKAERHKSN